MDKYSKLDMDLINSLDFYQLTMMQAALTLCIKAELNNGNINKVEKLNMIKDAITNRIESEFNN